MSKNSQYAAWSKACQSPSFPYTSMPAYAAIPLFPCLFYLRVWTLSIALITTIVIWYMSKKGYTLSWFALRLRGILAGNRYTSRPTIYIRRLSRRDWTNF